MRFSKAPLIATLMAVVLSLLVILPALAENSVKTDGQKSLGDVTGNRVAIGVFSDPLDAQYDWQAFNPSDDILLFDREDRMTADANATALTATFQAGAIAYLLDDIGSTANSGTLGAGITLHPADPRNTFFDGTLYVSNDPKAYNTVLINTQRPWAEATESYDVDEGGNPDEQKPDETAGVFCVMATVVNERTNVRLSVPLVNALPGLVPDDGNDVGDRDDDNDPDDLLPSYSKFQNFFEVIPNDDPAGPRPAVEATSSCDDFFRPAREGDTSVDPVITAAEAGKAGPTEIKMPQQIPARSGDTLTIRIARDTNVIELVVDGEGPTISDVTPEHNTIQDSEVLRVAFTARDELSGLRHDAEQVLSEGPNYSTGDGDPTVSNLDKDNFESNEPISDRDGRSTDINVWFGPVAGKAAVKDDEDTDEDEASEQVNGVIFSKFGNIGSGGASDISIGATDKWTVAEVGREYDFRLTYVLSSSFGGLTIAADSTTPVFWLVEARDRAGNVTRTDAVVGDDEGAAGDTPYRVTIDQKAPELQNGGAPETGITYNSKSKREVTDREYLAFQFAPDGTNEIGDELDPDSIDIGDFYVEGFTILSYIHPTDEEGNDFDKNANGTDQKFDPRSRVYVKLDRALESGERPEVQLRHGAVRDLAGNPNAGTAPEKAIDRIGPLLTVTVNGAVQDRPVIMADDGELDIEVSADETLRGRPEIWFGKIRYVEIKDLEDTKNIDESEDSRYEVVSLVQGDPLIRAAGDETSWSKTYDTDDMTIGTNDEDTGHYAVIISAVDSSSDTNPGYTEGWKWDGKSHVTSGSTRTAPMPLNDDDLDIEKLDDAELIFEVDNALPEAVISVTPARVDDKYETESRYPFIHIEFNGLTDDDDNDVGEDKEYYVGPEDGKGDLKDSHDRVVLNSLTVNGTSMLSAVLRVQGDDGQFSLALSRQELSDYEVEYEAVDDAGNEVEGDYTFSIVPRAPYKVALVPGWNLISLPGTPLDQSIDSVMVATSASAVLGYRNGNWETAIRGKVDGVLSPWQGSLTSMEGGYGFWIQTDQFESIETLIPEVDPASTLPTVPVAGGWNLLGVIDVRQAKAGDSPLLKSEADDYFTSIPWRVAYSFETIQNAWTKLIPEVTAQVDNEATEDDLNDTIDDPSAVEIANGKGYWVWSSEPGTLVP